MLFVLMSWNEMRIEEVGFRNMKLRFLKLFLCFNWLFDIIVCIKKKKLIVFFFKLLFLMWELGWDLICIDFLMIKFLN